MKKIFIVLMAFMVFSCSKSNQDKPGTLGVYNESYTTIVDSVLVDGVIYVENLGRVRHAGSTKGAGVVEVYLSKAAIGAVISFRDSENRKTDVVVTGDHFYTFAYMVMDKPGYLSTITIPQ